MLRLNRTTAHRFDLARLHVHPTTRYARRWGTLPADARYLVGIPSAWEPAPDLATAVSMHQALDDSCSPIVQVVIDRNVLKNRGRYVDLGNVSTDSTLPGMLSMDKVNTASPRMRKAGTFYNGWGESGARHHLLK